MSSIRCRAACNKALRPTVRSKLSPSGDVVFQNVAVARRFVDVFIAITLIAHPPHAGIVATIKESLRARMTRQIERYESA
jgi:hypothetical protein